MSHNNHRPSIQIGNTEYQAESTLIEGKHFQNFIMKFSFNVSNCYCTTKTLKNPKMKTKRGPNGIIYKSKAISQDKTSSCFLKVLNGDGLVGKEYNDFKGVLYLLGRTKNVFLMDFVRKQYSF